jgi:ferric-dicitrate binding protein FerR (iron transport regulator)
VTHNESKPFYVHSGKIAVKVLGTSFNVKSYPDENKIETTLVSGSVKIIERSDNQDYEISTLRPNEQAVYYKSSRKISIKNLNPPSSGKKDLLNSKSNISTAQVSPISAHVESIVLWKDQKLIFENETLEDIAKKLSRWYGKNVHIESENLKSNKYTGKFIYNETIYEVLDVISLTTDLKYYKKDHEIYIVQNNKP